MYKFMDDMDALSEEFGGNASFFVGSLVGILGGRLWGVGSGRLMR